MANMYSVEWMCESLCAPAGRVNLVETADVTAGCSRTRVPCAVEPPAPISQRSSPPEPQISPTEKKPASEEPPKAQNPCSPANSCGYTSGSESEVADSEGEAAARRRMRTKFTAGQIYKLESTFNKHRYLGATQRRKIAENLHLSETQVKTWFQNRRMKLKRQVQDMSTRYWSSTLPHVVLPRGLSTQQHAFNAQRFRPPAASAHALYAPLGPQLLAPRVIARVQPSTFPPCFY